MKKVFGIGITGLVGSRMVELLGDTYSFQNLSIETGTDITNPETLRSLSEDVERDIVILLAAKADVDACELDREKDSKILHFSDKNQQIEEWKKEKTAWWINVEGVRNVVEACKKRRKKIIYISTDFVFHGDDTPDSGYTEESIPHPLNWYGETKFQAEEVVKNSELPYCIVRLSYPYRTPFPAKKDFVQAVLPRLKEGMSVAGVTDLIMTPTYLDDFATAIDALIANQSVGTYHVVGSQSLSPFEAIEMIGKIFEVPTTTVIKKTMEEYYRNRAPRPSNLTMNNDRIEQLGVKMRTFEEGLFELKKQL